MKPWKSRSITYWDGFLSQNQPIGTASEAQLSKSAWRNAETGLPVTCSRIDLSSVNRSPKSTGPPIIGINPVKPHTFVPW